jgi:hypothetical protein
VAQGKGTERDSLLLDIPKEQRKIKEQGYPITIDEEEERQDTVYGSFGNDVRVETVAEIDRVDIVAGLSEVVSRLDRQGK